MSHQIPLSIPDMSDAEIRAVSDVLRQGKLGAGTCVAELELLVAKRAGRPHGIAVSSGTAALHLALLAVGIRPGDEVLTPAFSYIATANCIEYIGAKPVFVDCDPSSLNLSASAVETKVTERTKAIIGVEVFGNPAGMLPLAALATKHEIPLIEDACQALGGRHGKDPAGHFGRVSIFSFGPHNQLTTGEGGMIVTHDDKVATACRLMRHHGCHQSSESADELGTSFHHECLGFNYRMSELNAALGVSQMKRLDALLQQRERIAEMYTRRLLGHSDLILPTIQRETAMSWPCYVVRLNDRFTEDDRDQIIAGLRRHEVGAGNAYPAIPLQSYYRRKYGYKPGDFPVAESVAQRTIALPFFTRLTEREVDLVCQTLELMMTRQAFSRS